MTTRKPLVLVVDDTPDNITILKKVLEQDCAVRPAINGKAALKAVLVAPMPDLILLDVMMPELDGYEVCRQLKADPRTREIPVIFVTARSQVADEVQGLEMGAVDYIVKPISPPIVLARVRTHLALSAANRQLESHNRRLMDERDLMEAILLKMHEACRFESRWACHLAVPLEATAGDMHLAAFAPDGRHLVFLGDMTGHGLPAAIAAPLVSYIFSHMVDANAPGERLLWEVNRQLNMRLPVGFFCAAILLEIDAGRDRATVWNAAMPEVLWLREGVFLESCVSESLPLGVAEELAPDGLATHLELASGDRLYLYSDGIIEAVNPEEEPFGLPRLQVFLQEMAVGVTTLEDLPPLLETFTNASVHDDLTLIEVMV
ncbi:MAG: SpoIIE family protein phosphatase [Magnetococcales bacterium]|nr:SpoIIE family protein phosphatase [Magnetococcales bacterium]